MPDLCRLIFAIASDLLRSRVALEAEILVLMCCDPPIPRYLIRDHKGAYGEIFIRRVRSIGIRDRPTSPRSPCQNAYAERLVGSIRRECLDNIVVFGERLLRHVPPRQRSALCAVRSGADCITNMLGLICGRHKETLSLMGR
jgi:transposase InsO family protein